jgi:preprotein translocase SecE subunit
VARDRQRAKQRRRRQSGGTGPTGPARTRPRQADAEPREADIEPREADVEPRGAQVEPVEQEPMSTVFPQRGDVQPVESDEPAVEFDETVEPAPEFDETVEPAPDELDPAVREEAHERRAPRRARGRVITFLGHVVDELRRVQWPDRRHVGQGTAVVLGFVVIAGAFLGLMDAIWKPLIEAIL